MLPESVWLVHATESGEVEVLCLFLAKEERLVRYTKQFVCFFNNGRNLCACYS